MAPKAFTPRKDPVPDVVFFPQFAPQSAQVTPSEQQDRIAAAAVLAREVLQRAGRGPFDPPRRPARGPAPRGARARARSAPTYAEFLIIAVCLLLACLGIALAGTGGM